MLKRIFFLTILFVLVFITGVQPALAQDNPPKCETPPCVYVDVTTSQEKEDGTGTYPYNTENEGKALAQSYTGGAWLYVRDKNGTWQQKVYIPRATPGKYGTPLSDVARYAILAAIALILVMVGLWLIRRSHQLQMQRNIHPR